MMVTIFVVAFVFTFDPMAIAKTVHAVENGTATVTTTTIDSVTMAMASACIVVVFVILGVCGCGRWLRRW